VSFIREMTLNITGTQELIDRAHFFGEVHEIFRITPHSSQTKFAK
jgi:hypothetical protein